MARNEIHQYDIGTAFTATIMDDDEIVDVSDATAMYLLFEKPSGTAVTKTALPVTDGKDGKIRYVTVLNDLDESGQWYIQAHLIGPTYNRRSERKRFIVYPNIS